MNSVRTVLLLLTFGAVPSLAQLVITTPSPLPTAVEFGQYSVTFAAINGDEYAWSIAGNVPPGLSHNPETGELSGTPFYPGIYIFDVTVFSGESSGVKQFELRVNPQLFINTEVIFQGQVGVPFNQLLSAAGGETPYTWALRNATSLPAGLTLNPVTGAITGVPTGPPGQFFFDVSVSDAATPSQTSFIATIQIDIAPAVLTIVTTALPAGVQGRPYTDPVVSFGGTPPITWTVDAGSLPPGMGLSSAGVFTGAPQQNGLFTFTLRVVDSGEQRQEATRGLSLLVVPPVSITTLSPLPGVQAGTAYSQQLTASGGTPPYVNWGLTGGALPPGLTLSAAGLLGGTPTTAGNFSFTVRVQDSTPLTVSNVGTKTFNLQITPPPLTITTASPLPAGQSGTAYSQQFAATGGTPPHVNWGITGGALPPGLTLSSTGLLAGTPTSAGNFSFTVRVQDSTALTTPNTITKNFILQIAAPQLTISTASPLAPGQSGTAYSQQLAATGGTPPYVNWGVTNGALPPGLTLSTGGLIAGTPTTAGDFSFTVRVQDSTTSTTPNAATKNFNLQISPSSLTISTASPLPVGQSTTAYSQQLAATGGTPPYVNWSVIGGALPPGLTLSTSGLIAGTPTSAGSFSFTVRVQDSTAATTPNAATKAFALQITPPPLTITTGNPLPGAEPGSPYNLTFTAQGGAAPYAWNVQSGNLPPGLTLSSGGGLSGEVGAAGDYSFVLRVQDAANVSTTKNFNLPVAPVKRPFEIRTTSLPDGTTGVFYGSSVFARGGTSPYTFSMTGLPPGVQSNAEGNIDGTPTRAGTYTVRVSASDADRAQASATFTIVIKPGQVEVFTLSIPEGRVNASYSATFGARGGVPSYSWSLSGGTLPAGLSFNNGGDLSGTPTETGTFSFTVQATDQEKQSGAKGFTLVVRTGALTITTATLPNGTAGAPYSGLLAASGGSKPYKWSLSGSTPAGLSVNADSGDLSGTPTAPGTYTFAAQVGDADSVTLSKTFTITVAPPLVISTTSPLPSIIVGTAGSAAFSATGGAEPYSWSIASGTPPNGMNFAAGQLTGTPITVGVYSFSVQVTDANKASTTKPFTLEVLPGITITTESLPGATVGAAYSGSLAAAGGAPPYHWSAAGSLPEGITVDDGGGIAGLPTAAGTYTFTAQVRDSTQPTARTTSRSLTMVVSLPQISEVNISGVPASTAPAQQLPITLTIGSPLPVDVSGTTVLTFAPDATNNADDPAIQFSTGGRLATFNIPAGQTQAVFGSPDLLLQTGTVAGTITVTTSFNANGTSLTCSCSLVETILIGREAPVISSVRLTRNANGFNLAITGFSSTREMTRGVFRFSGTSALETNEVIIPLTDVFNTYYRGNAQFGGQFVLAVPFVIQGQAGDVTSVSIVLSNTAGDSQPSTASP